MKSRIIARNNNKLNIGLFLMVFNDILIGYLIVFLVLEVLSLFFSLFYFMMFGGGIIS
jgi:hypothetical protein